MFTFLIVKIHIGFHFRRVKWSNIAHQTIHFFTRYGLISFVADPLLEHCIINITTTRNCKVIGNFMCHTATWKFQHRTTCTILQFFFQHNYTRVRKSTRVGNKSKDSLSQKKKKGLENSWLMLIQKIIQTNILCILPISFLLLSIRPQESLAL